MKIALLGYGKMGHEIEKIAIEKGHTIGVTIDNEAEWIEKTQFLEECDVAIEFSIPAIAVQNINKCFDSRIPVVVGTTGWHDKLPEITEICNLKNGTLFYASNFSIGVNLFFDINRRLASLMEKYEMYSPSMVEIHHTQKLDAPSGTAISLAKGIIENNSRFVGFTDKNAGINEIPIESIREGNASGTHSVTWSSEIDTITITHEAHNRRGFAIGAVMAALWLPGHKGIFTMNDLLNL
jgi:4-hydroxy-tetrahydrodipicolinate reductase